VECQQGEKASLALLELRFELGDEGMAELALQSPSGHKIDNIYPCGKSETAGSLMASDPRSASDMVHSIWKEGELWVQAGARWLAALGWPSSSPPVVSGHLA
jgi:hypothetical protein